MPSSPRTALQPPASAASTPAKASITAPAFIIEWEPWWTSFAHNLAGVFHRQPGSEPLKSHPRIPPAVFWPDVFVRHGLPRRGLAISAIYHAAALSIIYALPALLLFASRMPRESPASRAPLTFYQVSEYLPPVNPAPAPSKSALHQTPQLARQTVISVHQHADNRQQTVVDPESVKVAQLPRPAPNLFVMGRSLHAPAVPVAAIPQPATRLVLPTAPVHMPTPDVPASSASALNFPATAVPAVVDPAPALDSVPSGAINMTLAKIDVAPPRLPVPQQQAASPSSDVKPAHVNSTDAPKISPAPLPAVPPPPVIAAGSEAGSAEQGRLIALNLHPESPQGPVELPQGNRNGDFAATPAGDPQADGTPGNQALEGHSAGNPEPRQAPEIPGILIAAGGQNPVAALASEIPTFQAPQSPHTPEAAAQQQSSPGIPHSSPRLLASVTPPRISDLARRPALPPEPGVAADTFFAGKKYYSLVLNMPNLTSAGGSWVIRFAELTRQRTFGDLTAPVALDKVDPAYPPQLIRDQVEGIVTLYAVIRSDGSVAEVRVLKGINNLLDENARVALSRWRFRPATRNGAAVDLEAVVQIPFKLRKLPF
jgi:TonB family protein